jgi:GTPase-associated adaptor domain-containing protein/calcineurin-like phosphoesterase family protein
MAQTGLNFIHLSDIHLVKDFSDISNYDLDLGLRQAILRDIDRMRPSFEDIAGVLISGDIAFAGKLDEYERATAWLNEICDRAKCDRGLVWCVPGNHDVDQSVQKTYPMLLDSYRALRTSTTLDKDLRERMDNDVNGPLMFEPLRTYHERFGAIYGCPTTPKKPWWEDELILNDTSRLKIRGINSAICSSRDDKEKVAQVIVGAMQTIYQPEPDVVYLTLCHHPTDWLVDGDACEEAILADSHIVLFGHKHSHKHHKTNDTVILSSGAVHPVRTEKPWDPRYYFLSLEVDSTDGNRVLNVRLFPRVWDKTTREFMADKGTGADGSILETISLPTWKPTIVNATAQPEVVMPVVTNRKRLIHEFMLLPFHSQLGILRKLNLFSDEEMQNKPDTELFISSFAKAKEAGKLDSLWEAIEAQGK